MLLRRALLATALGLAIGSATLAALPRTKVDRCPIAGTLAKISLGDRSAALSDGISPT